MRQEKIIEFEKKIGYTFENPYLLVTALTHSSYSNEKRLKKYKCNERLEFLGDAVLELISSEYIFKENPQKPEGDLTRIRASYVCEPTLAACAREISLGDYLLLGKGEDRTGGRERDSILSDAMEATIGAVYLDGEELHSMSVKSSARKMAVVAQHNYYNFDFTVREVVLMGRAPHKKTLERDNAKDYQIVDEALKTVQMETFADRTFSTLSGGEQQRVILARALAQQTPALILDEPTNHLDITHQIMLMELVKKLNVTVISAIHDLNIAAAYCDKIYVLKDGVLESYGTPQEVLTPELIRRIYKVEAEVVYDSLGKMHILFL